VWQRTQTNRLFQQLSHYSQFGAWVYLRWQTLTQPMDRQRNYQAMYKNPDSLANTQTPLQNWLHLPGKMKQDWEL
jgi:cytochrome c-type biogenesis protein CcmH/NrfG